MASSDQGVTNSSQKNLASKKSSKQKGCTCPVCLEVILKATAKKPGDDAIECSKFCKTWLHRRCAGLSKEAFQRASLDEKPFWCPRCQVCALEVEILALKSDIDMLKLKTSSIVTS